MLNDTFYLDGVDARSVGIRLQAPIEFSEAVPVVETQSIPGRNGDLIWETGSYENRSGSASCFCLQKDVERAVSAAGRFLMGKKGYRRLETSDDPDHYWLARVESSPQIAMRMRTLAPFDVDFDCKPQRFLKSGEQPIIFDSSATAKKIYNSYGFTAKPLIKVCGSGSGYIFLGRYVFQILSIDGELYIDSDLQNAYNNEGNQNMSIKCSEFPLLDAGESQIGLVGDIERIEIIPRWWEL